MTVKMEWTGKNGMGWEWGEIEWDRESAWTGTDQ